MLAKGKIAILIITSLGGTCKLLNDKIKIDFLFEKVWNYVNKNVCHTMLISFV